MNVISFDLVQKNPIFRFFGTFNRPKTPKPVPQKIATLFFGGRFVVVDRCDKIFSDTICFEAVSLETTLTLSRADLLSFSLRPA